MFGDSGSNIPRTFRLAVVGLLGFSVAALAVAVWLMIDFLREQEILSRLIREIPPAAAADAHELAGELRWQFRLSILVVLNMVVTGCAVILLWRAYSSSQRSLRDMKVLAGDILNSMDQAVITTDLQDRITSINRRGFELLHVDATAIGRPVAEACKELPTELLRHDPNSGATQQTTRDFDLTRSDDKRILRAVSQPLSDRAGNEIGRILQLRDVTEPLLVEQQVRRMERFMGMGSLAAGLHHEIKNPLAALSLHVQLLEEQLDDGARDGSTEEALQVIKAEINRVTGVLESFRNYADSDKLDRTSVDLPDLVRRLVALLSPQAREQKVELVFNADPAVPSISADQTRIEQTVLNLLLNAIEAMPGGGRVEVRVCNRDDHVALQVRDFGRGIPENLRERIFDPYFSTKQHGTGMGLAVCEKIIREHQGQIDLRPAHPGTLVELTLPAEGP